MKERSEPDRQADDPARAKRKRWVKRIARGLGLSHVSLWLLAFLVVLRTGYLSRIGIACGVLYLLPGFVAFCAGSREDDGWRHF